MANGNYLFNNLPDGDYTVTVTVTGGLDGIAGNSDDVPLRVDTTDAAGDYGFTGLPDGSYSVAVTSGLPAGLDTNTFDGDDLAVSPNSISIVTDLGVGDANPVNNADQDFGYTGTGSIGDTIDPATLPPGVVITGDPDGTRDGITTVTVGPGADVTTIDFGVRAPPPLPATGRTIVLTLALAALLLAAGWFLVGATRRRRRLS